MPDPEIIKVVPDTSLAEKSAADVSAMLDALIAPTLSGTDEPDAPADTPEADPAAPLEAAPQVSEPPADDPLEDLRLTLQEEGLRREKLEAQLAHEKLMREQGNTRAGTFKKLATDLLRDGRKPPEDDPEYSDDTPVNHELRSMQQELASLREEANTRVSQETMMGFVNSVPDLATDTEEARELLAEMQPHVKAGREEHSDLLDSGNPRLVRETTKLILKTAYIEAKAARLAKTRASAAEKRAQQFADRGKTIAAAAISGTGSAPPARPKPKTDAELSAQEAGAKLDEMARRAGLAR